MRRSLALTITIIAAAVAACGSGDGAGGDRGNSVLPENRRPAIAAPFAAELEALGLRVTRGALVDRTTGRSSRDATHLAVYVEPTGPYSPDDFAAGIETVTRVFLPVAFDRWPGLTSFDVCQEPELGVDDRRVPAPKTQIDISRAASEKIDWDDAGLGAILAGAASDPDDVFTVFADADVTASATFQEHAPSSSTAAHPGTSRY